MTPTSRIALAICRSEVASSSQRWYHTLPPVGVYPMPIHLPGGTVQGVLVIDATAQARISQAFAAAASSADFPGVLVDREHASETPDGDTTAMAWAKELQIRADGIWTRWDLTTAGEPLILGHAYAYRSPAMALEPIDDNAKAQLSRSGAAPSANALGRWRPIALRSIALTNCPHFRDLTPALGRDQYGHGMPCPDNQTTTETPTMDRALICSKLGLDPAKATDDEILGALDALVKARTDGEAATAEATAAKHELATIKARALEADATAFVLAHKARIKSDQEATVLASYKANPDATKALFGALAEAAPTQATARARIQASAAATPGDRDPAATDKGNQRAAHIATVAARDNLSRREAIGIARREKPELWS
jgi:hypothetical protein